MADEDVATRAPESDAQEDVQLENEAEKAEGGKPDQGTASMGEHCVTDRPTPAGETPSGEVTKMADTDVYVSKPGEYS